METSLSRRQLVKTAVAGTSLSLGWGFKPSEATASQSHLTKNAWIKLHASNLVELTIERSEMGQGVVHGIATIFADEADFDINKLSFVHAGYDTQYNNREYNIQTTGGSNSINQGWDEWRNLAATFRGLMIASAASMHSLRPQDCRTEMSHVVHMPSGKKYSYGSLISEASEIDINTYPLKKKSEYKYLGKEMPRLDARLKARGEAKFGIDADFEGIKVATVIHPPFFKGKLKQIKNEQAAMTEGVHGIFEISNGVAVVADNYWLATQTAQKLEIEWQDIAEEKLNTDSLIKRYQKKLKDSGATLHDAGNVENELATQTKVIEAEYSFPFAAHKTMEPMNTSCKIENGKCYIQTPTQSPAIAQMVARQVTGFSDSDIEIETTYLGGGFGRRGTGDFVRDAVEVAKISKLPIRMIWSREEDSKNDFYRPMAVHSFRGALGKDGYPVAWHHKFVTQAILPTLIKGWTPAMMPGWMPNFISNAAGALAKGITSSFPSGDMQTEGAKEIPYNIKNLKVEMIPEELEIPIGFWRAVGHSLNGPAVECFMDELAEIAKVDPIAYRMKLLTDKPRYLGVMKKLVEISNWENRDQSKIYGVSQHFSFKSYTAQIVQLEKTGDKKFKIEKVFCAADCGFILNPDVVRSQLESGIIYGISAALYDQVPIKDNVPQISNFHDTPILRMTEAPEIETATVESSEKPTGVGEIATPSVIPALMNAVSRGIGQRVRTLPIPQYFS